MTDFNYSMPNILILPTFSCQAACSYCFGPHQQSLVMPEEILIDTARWIDQLSKQAHFHNSSQKINIIFHGGEPLLAGHDFYEKALSIFEKNVDKQVSFSMLSNLWAMDRRFAEIFKRHKAAVAVSLDGPEEINDRQRGEGYFKRSMAGLKILREAGVPVSAICTFTPLSAPEVDKVFKFFVEQKLEFQFKTVVEPFEVKNKRVDTLSYEAHLKLIERLFELFFEHAEKIRIKTLERMVHSIVTRENAMYIPGNCLGKQVAVDPEGGIYHCQRFAGIKKYQWASVTRQLSMEQLKSTTGYCIYSQRMEKVKEECSKCLYSDICAGGCAYNAFNNQSRKGMASFKDPECSAYRGILDNIMDLIGKLMMEDTENNPDIYYRKKIIRLLLKGMPKPSWPYLK